MTIKVGDVVPYGNRELRVTEVQPHPPMWIKAIDAHDGDAFVEKYEGEDLTHIFIAIAARRAGENRRN